MEAAFVKVDDLAKFLKVRRLAYFDPREYPRRKNLMCLHVSFLCSLAISTFIKQIVVLHRYCMKALAFSGPLQDCVLVSIGRDIIHECVCPEIG